MGFESLRHINYDNADVMLLAFDIDKPETFQSIENTWIGECVHFTKDAKILLVGIQSG